MSDTPEPIRGAWRRDAVAIESAEGDHVQWLRASYTYTQGSTGVELADVLGRGVVLTPEEAPVCQHCGEPLRRADGERGRNPGYCFQCATTLARCDLCFVSPDRCHHHLGTCREPEWGARVCMAPHTVYLATTSGPKVGVTRAGREHGRWIDQGAHEAIAILSAPTRRVAGFVEAALKAKLNDKTDWRALVSAEPKSYDLASLAKQLQRDFGEFPRPRTDSISDREWSQLRWLDSKLTRIEYPRLGSSPAERLSLKHDEDSIRDNLVGAVGPYLLLTQGVFNLSAQPGTVVAFTDPVEAPIKTDEQMSLF